MRQLSLPGVHTKFVENHRAVISELAVGLRADYALTAEDVVGESIPDSAAEPGSMLGLTPSRTPAARFAAGHGFLHPPELVRFRLLDPDVPLLGQAPDLLLMSPRSMTDSATTPSGRLSGWNRS